ncbi:hypothetical protein CBR_g11995 [Chara braunii]|uniref:F-box domain-containing protein n=1 Tax=Chara braunii TaxID=69332 RepID=A0A388KQV0_CHABU|nr:hypothetical protein CBR_g11995 [Chara braunii]|eukprot:GBG72416.1 hypothetical protein CBR_g11995 [Chara braunii]
MKGFSTTMALLGEENGVSLSHNPVRERERGQDGEEQEEEEEGRGVRRVDDEVRPRNQRVGWAEESSRRRSRHLDLPDEQASAAFLAGIGVVSGPSGTIYPFVREGGGDVSVVRPRSLLSTHLGGMSPFASATFSSGREAAVQASEYANPSFAGPSCSSSLSGSSSLWVEVGNREGLVVDDHTTSPLPDPKGSVLVGARCGSHTSNSSVLVSGYETWQPQGYSEERSQIHDGSCGGGEGSRCGLDELGERGLGNGRVAMCRRAAVAMVGAEAAAGAGSTAGVMTNQPESAVVSEGEGRERGGDVRRISAGDGREDVREDFLRMSSAPPDMSMGVEQGSLRRARVPYRAWGVVNPSVGAPAEQRQEGRRHDLAGPGKFSGVGGESSTAAGGGGGGGGDGDWTTGVGVNGGKMNRCRAFSHHGRGAGGGSNGVGEMVSSGIREVSTATEARGALMPHGVLVGSPQSRPSVNVHHKRVKYLSLGKSRMGDCFLSSPSSSPPTSPPVGTSSVSSQPSSPASSADDNQWELAEVPEWVAAASAMRGGGGGGGGGGSDCNGVATGSGRIASMARSTEGAKGGEGKREKMNDRAKGDVNGMGDLNGGGVGEGGGGGFDGHGGCRWGAGEGGGWGGGNRRGTEEEVYDDGEESEEMSSASTMDITDDLLHKVFSFLDYVGLCNAARVCKQWRIASSHEDFWRTLNFENKRITLSQVVQLCARYPRATTLNLKGATCADNEHFVRDSIRTLTHLETLVLGKGIFSESLFWHISTECPSLKRLSITEAVLGSTHAQEILVRHDSLQELQIVKCRVIRIAVRCPQLEFLSLKSTSAASASLTCPQLLHLDVSNCHKLPDSGVRAAATLCPLLQVLDVKSCENVTDETLRDIAVACPSLTKLDASHCPGLALEGLRMPNLVEMKLEGCEGINTSSMTALGHCEMLETLVLNYCWLLQSVTLDLPRLQSISLKSCRKLMEVALRSPALKSLDVTQCHALHRIDVTSKTVESLVLKHQTGLASMALRCPLLRDVDLSNCDALTNAVFDVFSDLEACPLLSLLVLDSCEGLTEVKLSSCKLSSLSLVGCRNIASIDLSCQSLGALHLDGCDRLTEARFSPVGLQSLNLGICPHLASLVLNAPEMTVLDLRGCGTLKEAHITCPKLTSLDASYCSRLGDEMLAATASACLSLQTLVLAACPAIGAAGLLALKGLPALNTLDLSYTEIQDLSPVFEACPQIRVLRVSACKWLDDAALAPLYDSQALMNLRELDVSYCNLSNAALGSVLALCPRLVSVNLSGCENVTDLVWDRISGRPLASDSDDLSDAQIGEEIEKRLTSDQGIALDLYSGERILEQVRLQSPAQEDEPVVGLQYMDIDAAEASEREGEDSVMSSACGSRYPLACARKIGNARADVAHCQLLANEDGYMSLDSLDLSPDVLGPEFVGTVRTDTEILRRAGELGKPLMSDDDSRALQTLICVGCKSIRCAVVLENASCNDLTCLNLSLSRNLREVRLACSNLRSLNLSNCVSLVTLKLQCPRLTSLFLQACCIEVEVLRQAVRSCAALETLDVRNCCKVTPAVLTHIREVCPQLKRLYNSLSG